MRRALVAVALCAVFAACAPANERGATGRGALRAANGTPDDISGTSTERSGVAPAVILVVLPKATGSGGAVVVRSGEQQVVIDEPYAAAQVHANGEVERISLDASEVQQRFSEAISALPARPATFLLYFEGNSDRLTPDSVAQLQQVLDQITQRGSVEISVSGHTDRAGSMQHNDALSLARARRVRDELVSRGVQPGRFTRIAGRGERELLIVTDDNVAEPRNRRVEIGVR